MLNSLGFIAFVLEKIEWLSPICRVNVSEALGLLFVL